MEDPISEVGVTVGKADVTVPLNPTLVGMGDVLGTAVPFAVTVTTTVVTTTTVATPFAPVVVDAAGGNREDAEDGAGVTRGVEEVRGPVPVPVDTMGEVEWLEAALPIPVEVPNPKVVTGVEATGVVAKVLLETIDE